MTLDQYRSLADRALVPFVSAARAAGLSPNGVSVIAFLLAVGAGVVYAFAARTPLLYFAGALLVFFNGWLDVVDGALARELDVASAGGDLLDHVLDRYADLVIIVGLAAGLDRWALGVAAVTGVLMTSYLGTQAEAVGLDRVYGGLLGRADRLALVGLTTGVAAFVNPDLLGVTLVGWLLVVFAVVGHITAVQRFYYAMRALD
ncbi:MULTISPECIES: CDP-alcohol phosphatidyltransferase family protein [Haloarcula]|uniref:CDP-alcohol phosphatidyltransferase family protein n=1 Tax=Haloarcula TaxID=2237 RepID=UPI0023ECB11E|nr:CDP-alcohol phosphatidyltransferase family protein [Halomicroarcula sp. XH51]